jgi:ribosomal protein S8
MIESISYTISVINNGVQHKKKTIKVRNFNKKIINILMKFGFVSHIVKVSDGFIIFLNSWMGGKFKIINYYRKHSRLKLTHNQITKLKYHQQSSVYIFQTDSGFITQHDLVEKKISGILVLQIVLK